MCAHASKTLKSPLSTPSAAKCQNEGQRGPSVDIDMIVGTPPASAQTEPGPEPRLNARLGGRVVRAIWLKSKNESQTVSHSGFVISGAYHRPSLHQPPSLVLASFDILYPLLPSLSTLSFPRIKLLYSPCCELVSAKAAFDQN
jgi:hypothetical protein